MELHKNKATSGNIPTKTLKPITRDICVPLTDCINSAILNGVFPDELKLADVTPLYKKSDPEDKTNYRPISVLPSLSNAYEKILCKQLNSFFETKLSPHLCGFRSRCSTQNALSNLLFNWQNCSDKSGTILMDLPKAFYCLPHDLIIAKLSTDGLDHDSLKLIRSHLSNRHQGMKLESIFSSWMQTITRATQGSILGPLLFKIFLNNLLLINLRPIVCNFAGDNTLYYCVETTQNIIKNLQ